MFPRSSVSGIHLIGESLLVWVLSFDKGQEEVSRKIAKSRKGRKKRKRKKKKKRKKLRCFFFSLFILLTVSSLRTAQYFPERREQAENGEEWGEGR